MKGQVLGHDSAAQATVLRGEDGRRYRFSSFEWREGSAPEKGEEVDFEPEGARARDVYRAGGVPLRETNSEVSAAATHRAEAAGSETPAQALLRQPFMQFLRERPVLPLSLLVLIACLLTAYTLDGARMSLLAAPELAWRMSMAIDGLLIASGADPARRLAGAAARIASVFQLFLYVVPALAAVTAWREFVGRPDMKLARLAGIAAMTLPVALPALVILLVRVGVLPGLDAPLRLGREGLVATGHTFHPISLYSAGTVLLVLAGFGLWAAATGRLAVWLAASAGIPSVAGSASRTSSAELSASRTVSRLLSADGAAVSRQSKMTYPSQGPSDRRESVGPSREAMMALTERLRLAISGTRASNAKDQPAHLPDEEVDAVYAPPARDSKQQVRAASSAKRDQEIDKQRNVELAIARPEERQQS